MEVDRGHHQDGRRTGLRDLPRRKKEGTCYELYAKDKDGKLWELFFNPVDGVILEKEEKS